MGFLLISTKNWGREGSCVLEVIKKIWILKHNRNSCFGEGRKG